MMGRERRRGEGDEVSPALLLALEVQVPSPNDCHVTWRREEEGRRGEKRDEEERGGG